MDEKQVRLYIGTKPECLEDYPFGPDVLVYKVRGKMFALLTRGEWQGSHNVPRINLKCDPDEALALRDIFDAVIPGYHMNKKHWNTVVLDGTIPPGEIERMIDHSYGLVVKGLKAAERKAMELKYCSEALYK